MSKKQVKEVEPMSQFYSLERMDNIDAHFKMIIGERSNGKSFAVLERILKNYCQKGECGVIVRRWAEDILASRASLFFDGLVHEGLVEKYTNGEWTNISYRTGKFYLSRFDSKLNKYVSQEDPFCFTMALTNMEHDKSTSRSNVTTLLFDEFITRSIYLKDEFSIFSNVISTVARYRNNLQIYMLANTVSKNSIYFREMGIKHIDKMTQGKIDIYEYDKGLKVAVEYCSPVQKEGKPSDVYFAFDNPRLKMITGGVWEIDIYPHCPMKYKDEDIRFIYFIKWENDLLQCEVVRKDGQDFTFIHLKTTELKDEDNDLIYSVENTYRKNWSRNICKPRNKRESKVYEYFKVDRVYYQDNEVGETVRSYLQWCKQN